MDNLKIDRNGFWNRISKELESAVSSQTYATWFEPLRAVNIEEETVTVEVPSRFYYEWIDSHYGSLIQEKIKSVHGLDMQIRYTVGPSPLGYCSVQIMGNFNIFAPATIRLMFSSVSTSSCMVAKIFSCTSITNSSAVSGESLMWSSVSKNFKNLVGVSFR